MRRILFFGGTIDGRSILSLGRPGERAARRKDYTFNQKKLFYIGQSHCTENVYKKSLLKELP